MPVLPPASGRREHPLRPTMTGGMRYIVRFMSVTTWQNRRYALAASRKWAMETNPVLPVSTAKRRDRSGSRVARKGRILSSDRAASLAELTVRAHRCRTPKQFRELLEHLRRFIPYSHFVAMWGSPHTSIRYIFNHDFPVDLLRWRLTTGALWTSPAFQEWLETKRTILWCEAATRLKEQFDPELLRRMEKAHVQYSLCGGFAAADHFVLLAAAMPSAESGRLHLKSFDLVVPLLVEASQRAYPNTLLTTRETAVLKRRAM